MKVVAVAAIYKFKNQLFLLLYAFEDYSLSVKSNFIILLCILEVKVSEFD